MQLKIRKLISPLLSEFLKNLREPLRAVFFEVNLQLYAKK